MTLRDMFMAQGMAQEMPKRVTELSALVVQRLSKQGTYAVGGVPGLYLQIDEGSRAWVLRYKLYERRRKMGLGSYPGISLAQARDIARKVHGLIAQGIDPIEAKKAERREKIRQDAKSISFAKASELYIADKEHEWKNDKHRQQWQNTLATYAFPFIGQTPVGEVDRADVLNVLQPIWLEKTETAKRLRGRIEKILDWATVHEYREGENPARWSGHLEVILPRPSKIMNRRHHPALPYKEVPHAVKRIMQVEGMSAYALIFAILTAARTSEILMATWSEIDLGEKLWTIPARRMKAGREHRVPLSTQALSWLDRVPTFVGSDYLFPSRTMKPMSNMSMLVFLLIGSMT